MILRVISELFMSLVAVFSISTAVMAPKFNFSVFSRLNPFAQVKAPSTLSELLWTILVTDYVLKLITVVVKMMFTLLPQKLIATSKRVCILVLSSQFFSPKLRC